MSRSTRSRAANCGPGEEGSEVNITLIDLIKLVYRVDKDAVFSNRTKAAMKLTCKELIPFVNSRIDKLFVQGGELGYLASSSLCRTCVKLSIHGDITTPALCCLLAADLPMVEELELRPAMLPPKLLTCLGVKVWPKVRRLSLSITQDTAGDQEIPISNIIAFPALEELVMNVSDKAECSLVGAFVERLLLAKKSNIRRVDFRGVKLCDPVFNELMSLIHSNLEVFSFGLAMSGSLSHLNFAASSLLKFPTQNLKELAFAQTLGEHLKVLASLPVLKQIETLTIETIDGAESALSEFEGLLNGLKGGCLKSFTFKAPEVAFFEFSSADLPALEILSCGYTGDLDMPYFLVERLSEANIPLLRHLKISCPEAEVSLPDSFSSKDTFPLLEELEIEFYSICSQASHVLASRVPSLRSFDLRAASLPEHDLQIIFSESDMNLKTLHIEGAGDNGLLELAGHAANMPLLE